MCACVEGEGGGGGRCVCVHVWRVCMCGGRGAITVVTDIHCWWGGYVWKRKEVVYDCNGTELISSPQPADLGVRERVIHSQSEVNPTSEQSNSGSEMTTTPCRLERQTGKHGTV